MRDGLVYYRALKSERGRLDRYVAALNVPAATYGGWSKEQQIAFWLNAYNAFVLETVIDNYPIRGKSAAVPASSIKQIPGAFDQIKHRAAGRSVTLDEIEKTILPEFKDARLYLALGAARSAAAACSARPTPAQRLKRQLESVESEFVSDQQMIEIDRVANTVSVTPIMSWRDAEFVAQYDTGRHRSLRAALADRAGPDRLRACRTRCGWRRNCCRRTPSRCSSASSTGGSTISPAGVSRGLQG